MKTFAICFLMLLVTLGAIATDVEKRINEKIGKVSSTNLPFDNTKKISTPSLFALTDEELSNLPIFLYDDITLSDKYIT